MSPLQKDASPRIYQNCQKDKRNIGRSLLVYSSYWAIDFTNRRNPGLKVSEIVVAEG